jgi:hypothetical protein
MYADGDLIPKEPYLMLDRLQYSRFGNSQDVDCVAAI